MARPPFTERKFHLVGELQRQSVVSFIDGLPIDEKRPLEIVVREKPKTRGLDANARMWAGPLRDIADQAILQGKQFTAESWAYFFKREFLPEDDSPEADPANGYVKDDYIKWIHAPDGERALIGSTTQLTVRGFAIYLQQVEAFGASLGVHFSVSPNERKYHG